MNLTRQTIDYSGNPVICRLRNFEWPLLHPQRISINFKNSLNFARNTQMEKTQKMVARGIFIHLDNYLMFFMFTSMRIIFSWAPSKTNASKNLSNRTFLSVLAKNIQKKNSINGV